MMSVSTVTSPCTLRHMFTAADKLTCRAMSPARVYESLLSFFTWCFFLLSHTTTCQEKSHYQVIWNKSVFTLLVEGSVLESRKCKWLHKGTSPGKNDAISLFQAVNWVQLWLKAVLYRKWYKHYLINIQYFILTRTCTWRCMDTSTGRFLKPLGCWNVFHSNISFNFHEENNKYHIKCNCMKLMNPIIFKSIFKCIMCQQVHDVPTNVSQVKSMKAPCETFEIHVCLWMHKTRSSVTKAGGYSRTTGQCFLSESEFCDDLLMYL